MHDIERQITAIKGCLQESNRRIGFLVGAGCPQSILIPVGEGTRTLIPGIKELTEHVTNRLKGHNKAGEYADALEKELINHGEEDLTAEDMLNLVRNFKAVCVGGREISGFNSESLECLDTSICEIISELVSDDLPDQDTPYHGLAAWISGTERSYAVEVFTTNYDLLLEQAFEVCRVPYFDGFVGSHRGFFDIHTIESDPLPQRWTRLHKLHGSINWRSDPNGHVYRTSLHDDGSMMVIHPSHMKYQHSRRMPYLAMMDQLRDFLRMQSSVLVIIGYSFSDEHINELIVETASNNATVMVFGLVFGQLSEYSSAVKLAERCPQLAILAEDSAVIGMEQKKWDKVDIDSAVAKSAAMEFNDADDEGVANNDGSRQPKFMLGDFSYLGRFLRELSGTQFESLGNPDAG